ncbi:nitroreductase family deazaflavin-dependent oxidoreductase [Mycobacterium marseillense]|jgi:deazaflavin-dependent oxidoreductase (nitroreductase family)|uniref:Nitroreductase n=1 Tax=Mycobacterium marseillense TaxID=701042 RepID=A0ABM7J8W1_9MYCO|nr:nitroreductase family deazaflavin-dependent oxidoreductase [Mycobacterium marseillense]MCA2266339.1 nitroreductase family deazaflavin-dependent oxidoreductase [Mycobacterium marseillense]MCV7405549.1 nitroreductase family deazaflavin-dependent oxidoreductase [Mycobacterium marseillense]MDM3972740.1 nitroreductase family deazaflavin-dependent oxidoreductase [Mycobacterium marseillense]OBJ66484.1 nitroreductase [Mycobacterium marseillense]ORA86962.1 nitroreductase [Mycobacterium marseillense]
MNPLRRAARNPTVYRLLVRSGSSIVERFEALLRFATSGRLGVLDLVGLPNVRITTSGRRTGLARSATVQYVPFRGGLLLVGSNWGRERHPSWSANLEAAQRVTVRRRGQRFVAKAQLLTGADRDEAWAAVLDHWSNYRVAQDLAGPRQFRLFLLTPLT